MKTIVSKVEIAADSNLSIIKSFRLATKHIGQTSTAIANTTDEAESALLHAQYETLKAKRRALQHLADEQGFKIWINEQGSIFAGKTGHTYEKDYKETPDEQNDYEAFVRRVNPTPEPEITGLPTITEILSAPETPEEGEFDSGEE